MDELFDYNGLNPMVERSGNQIIINTKDYETITKEKQVIFVADDENSDDIVEKIDGDNGDSIAVKEENMTLLQRAKKVAVAGIGGAMVVVGIPLIPLPGTCNVHLRCFMNCL